MTDTPKKTTAKAQPDAKAMEAIRADYCAGILSLREVAAKHGVSPAAIVKWAKLHGWERNLAAKIQAKADAKVNAAVNAAVNSGVNGSQAASERQTIEANATAIAEVRLGHRTDIRTGRDLVRKLMGELTGLTDQPELVQQLADAVAPVDDEGDSDAAKRRRQRLNEALDRVMSLPGRVSAVKGLAEALKNLVTLEREAWGIDKGDPADAGDLTKLNDAELDGLISQSLANLGYTGR